MAKKLVSLKLSKKEVEDQFKPPKVEERDQYPFGLSLHLDSDTVAKLDASKLKAGDTVALVAEATVTTVSIRDTQDKSTENVTLQITDMALDGGRSADEQAAALFPSNKGESS